MTVHQIGARPPWPEGVRKEASSADRPFDLDDAAEFTHGYLLGRKGDQWCLAHADGVLTPLTPLVSRRLSVVLSSSALPVRMADAHEFL